MHKEQRIGEIVTVVKLLSWTYVESEEDKNLGDFKNHQLIKTMLSSLY